ncbi:MAG: methyltransferase domain-containing protein [Rhizobiales bacterium]|nr:methyltransferase domain-containing protein [Hyphomicrobiales bacterium]
MDDGKNDIHRSAAQGFSAKADVYARGRPDYPDAIVDWLRDRLGLRDGRTVIDLGAGTGKFTAYLLKTGAQVIAVEPVREMRAKIVQAQPNVVTYDGTATSIPLPDDSVDVVICAQAFHWFATREALAEIRRVLKPGGRLGLIWNVRDESVDWIKALTAIIAPHEGDTPRYASGAWRSVFPADGFSPVQEERFPHSHVGSPDETIIDRVCSTSFIAALPADETTKVVAQLRALIAATPALAGKDMISVPYTTAAYWTEKVG